MDAKCPYCNSDIEIIHDDGYGYEEDIKHQQECDVCGMTFTFTTSILFFYETEKASCLNGESHNYELTNTIPKEYSKMRCTMCEEERELTEEEKQLFGIDSKGYEI